MKSIRTQWLVLFNGKFPIEGVITSFSDEKDFTREQMHKIVDELFDEIQWCAKAADLVNSTAIEISITGGFSNIKCSNKS